SPFLGNREEQSCRTGKVHAIAVSELPDDLKGIEAYPPGTAELIGQGRRGVGKAAVPIAGNEVVRLRAGDSAVLQALLLAGAPVVPRIGVQSTRLQEPMRLAEAMLIEC